MIVQTDTNMILIKYFSSDLDNMSIKVRYVILCKKTFLWVKLHEQCINWLEYTHKKSYLVEMS